MQVEYEARLANGKVLKFWMCSNDAALVKAKAIAHLAGTTLSRLTRLEVIFS